MEKDKTGNIGISEYVLMGVSALLIVIMVFSDRIF